MNDISSSKPIGVGLIGYGLGGRAFHAPYIRTSPDLSLRAVVSRDPGKVHADIADVAVLSSVEEMLRLPGIELVVVSSPDHLHASHAIQALDAGKHVVIDKPFAASLAEARQIVAKAERTGRIVTAFHNRRWDADFRTLRSLIEEGVLGDIVHFESRWDRWRPQPAKNWKEARAGGSWMDLGPHLLDQAIVLFGPPETISADLATLREGAPSPDYFHVTLRYHHRRVILHSSKSAADHDLRFIVHGTKGSWIKTGVDQQEAATVAGQLPEGDQWGRDTLSGRLTLTEDGKVQPYPNLPGDYRIFWQALASAIRGAGPNPVPPSEAIAVMQWLDAALESARTDKVLRM